MGKSGHPSSGDKASKGKKTEEEKKAGRKAKANLGALEREAAKVIKEFKKDRAERKTERKKERKQYRAKQKGESSATRIRYECGINRDGRICIIKVQVCT